MTVAVRPARPEDHDAWFALFDAVAAEGRWIGAEAPLDPVWARRSFDRALTGERAGLLLAEDTDGLLVGHIGLTVAAGCAEIGMVVRAGHRRQGIGSALVVAGLDWCRARPDVHKATLSVWPHNTAALALYRRHGFVVEGRLARHVPRRDGTLWDLVLMALPLAPEPF